jgi:putative ABC transport system permease protein
LDPPSYVYAIVLTFASALLVDFLLYFKLEKINMAEALKSVE